MGCTLFWEAQEYSRVCQDRAREELVSLAEVAGWEHEVAPEEFTGHILNLESSPGESRIVERKFSLNGLTMFPFGREEDGTRPRLSFVFDNTNPTNPHLRNRLITLAPMAYWLEWFPRLQNQHPALAREYDRPVYGVRGDGSMRVRRTELPGFIKFLNTLRATSLPLLDIRTNDRLARKMINDPASGRAHRGGGERETLADIAEGLGVLFATHRYDEWKLGLGTEDEIEREQARANRAASMSSDRPGGRRGRDFPMGRGRDMREGRRF